MKVKHVQERISLMLKEMPRRQRVTYRDHSIYKNFRMDKAHIEFDEYHLEEMTGGHWRVYYSERGEESRISEFNCEDEACEAFLSTIFDSTLANTGSPEFNACFKNGDKIQVYHCPEYILALGCSKNVMTDKELIQKAIEDAMLNAVGLVKEMYINNIEQPIIIYCRHLIFGYSLKFCSRCILFNKKITSTELASRIYEKRVNDAQLCLEPYFSSNGKLFILAQKYGCCHRFKGGVGLHWEIRLRAIPGGNISKLDINTHVRGAKDLYSKLLLWLRD